MKLLEISEPGFYVVKDGELTEIADYDTDQEDALRLLALKIHLDDFTSSMTIDDDHRVTVGACTKFQGVGPDEAREACDILRKALVEAMARSSQEPYPIPPTFDFTKATVFDLKTLTYPVIEHFLKKFNPESLKTGLHTVLNTLYFLTTENDADMNLTYREAWGKVTIKDRRTPFQTCASEWLVLTDEEADEAWDESLDNYLDDCVLPEVPEAMRNYFDVSAWKRDARMDGRGHALSSYDGGEYSVEVDDQSFVLFRTN